VEAAVDVAAKEARAAIKAKQEARQRERAEKARLVAEAEEAKRKAAEEAERAAAEEAERAAVEESMRVAEEEAAARVEEEAEKEARKWRRAEKRKATEESVVGPSKKARSLKKLRATVVADEDDDESVGLQEASLVLMDPPCAR
jgi:colicin import membrane protein